jgi:hypothetical protein
MTMITSDNLSRICSLPRPHVYHTPDFCADVLDIPSLSNARVSIVEHLQEPRRPWHEYLLLSVINNNDGLDCIWIRCERSRDTTELPYAFKPIACPALDNVQISYDAKKLRNEKDKIIGSLQCGRSLLFVYTLELWRIIQDESSMWSLIGQNCWWYCSVNLYLYKKKFGGTWGDVPKPPKDDKLKLIQEKLGDFDSVTMKVITRYLGEPLSKNELRKLLRIPMAKVCATGKMSYNSQ